jgi:hypothetical protein
MNPATPSRDRIPWACQDRPNTSRVPLSGRIRPNSIRRKVVFPAPFGPRTPYTSPWETLTVMASTAVNGPYLLVTSTALTASTSLMR